MAQNRPQKEDDKTRNADDGNEAETPPLALTLDVAKYDHFFEEEDLTVEQKHEYLEAMWSIVVTFIAMGVTVRPAPETCGKPETDGDCDAEEGAPVVKSKPRQLAEQFGRARERTHNPDERSSRQ